MWLTIWIAFVLYMVFGHDLIRGINPLTGKRLGKKPQNESWRTWSAEERSRW